MSNIIKSIIVFIRYITVWSLPSRMNRIRYFVLSSAYGFLVIGSMLALMPLIIVYVFLVLAGLMGVLLTIKRLHDMNLSGKWVFVILGMQFFIGFINGFIKAATGGSAFIFLDYLKLAGNTVFYLSLFATFIISGTKGSNKFGTAPQKASKMEYIFAIIFIFLHIVYTLFKYI